MRKRILSAMENIGRGPGSQETLPGSQPLGACAGFPNLFRQRDLRQELFAVLHTDFFVIAIDLFLQFCHQPIVSGNLTPTGQIGVDR